MTRIKQTTLKGKAVRNKILSAMAIISCLIISGCASQEYVKRIEQRNAYLENKVSTMEDNIKTMERGMLENQNITNAYIRRLKREVEEKITGIDGEITKHEEKLGQFDVKKDDNGVLLFTPAPQDDTIK